MSLDTLLKIAQGGIADRVHVEWDTYFMDESHVVRPLTHESDWTRNHLRAGTPCQGSVICG